MQHPSECPLDYRSRWTRMHVVHILCKLYFIFGCRSINDIAIRSDTLSKFTHQNEAKAWSAKTCKSSECMCHILCLRPVLHRQYCWSVELSTTSPFSSAPSCRERCFVFLLGFAPQRLLHGWDVFSARWHCFARTVFCGLLSSC